MDWVALAKIASSSADPKPYYVLGGIAALCAVIAALFAGWREFHKWLRRLDKFYEDWYGEPERDGLPKRPGVMERLTHQDDMLSGLKTQVALVKAEVTLNSGGSLKDAVIKQGKLLADFGARLSDGGHND